MPASAAPWRAPAASTTTSARWTSTASTTASPSACRWASHGDVYDRYMIRFLEMRESVKILNRPCATFPPAPSSIPKPRSAASAPSRARPTEASNRPRASSASTSSATARPTPIAIASVPPSLINLTVLEDLCLGRNVADVVAILGSVDIVLGEVDPPCSPGIRDEARSLLTFTLQSRIGA
jgi:NADH:ubiquinone oxidoreductase subunit D